MLFGWRIVKFGKAPFALIRRIEAVNAVVHRPIDDKASLGAPGMWVHDPDEWDRVRVKLGRAIEELRATPAN